MLRTTLIPLLLVLVALPALAHDDKARTVVGAGVGGAVGAAVGSELGGRNEAIVGAAIGGALGAAIASGGGHDHHRHYRPVHRHHYREARRDYHWERAHWHKRHHRGPRHCPPGLAMQGRCGW
jgi:uncharacterized MnhB-related membrane protein